MNYIRVFNYSASPVILKGITRTYVVRGRSDRGPVPEDIPWEDVDYINARCDVFRTGTLQFDEEFVDEIMYRLRNPNWRDTQLTDEKLIDDIVHPTNDTLRRIIACNKRHEIERYRSALVAAQNANMPVTELVNRVIRDRFSEIANGVANSKIVLPEDYLARHADPKDKEIEAMREQNAAMEAQLAEMQKQLQALMEAQAKAEEPKKPKATRAKATKAEPTAE